LKVFSLFFLGNVYNAKKAPWLVLPGAVLTEAGKTTEVGPSDVTGPAAAASMPNHWNYNRREGTENFGL
jgi:hypothetical protein